MARGKRTRLYTGIYEDASGYAIVVPINGKPVEHRFKKHTIARDELRLKRLDLLRNVLLQRERVQAHAGTLAADVQTFLSTITSTTRRRDAASLLARWTAVFGDRSRHALTSTDIAAQLATWGHVPPATRKQLRQVLGQLYRVLNGRDGKNPVKDTPPITVRYEEPRALSYAHIEFLLKHVTAPQTHARLRVMAYTGLPQAQLARLQPHDVDLKRKTMYVKPRRKGAGVPGATFDLLPHAVTAFKRFNALNCWGPFSRSSMAKRWREAKAAAKATWEKSHKTPWPVPDSARAYDLRHSFLSEVLRLTGDYRAVNELAQHSTMNQTKRYTQSAASVRVKSAIGLAKRKWRGTRRGTLPK